MFYFVRHGQTFWNVENKICGATDIALTPLGHEQAVKTGEAVIEAGIAFDEIDTLYISGGFSAKINVANAVKTGLLPGELRDRCVAVNNSSLLGTVKYACEKNDLSAYLQHLQYVDLAADPVFSERFIENMTF